MINNGNGNYYYLFFLITFFCMFLNLYPVINYYFITNNYNSNNNNKLALLRCNSTSNFTIHGLWNDDLKFDYFYNEYILTEDDDFYYDYKASYCTKEQFNLSQIIPLVPIMNQVWFSCYDTKQNRYYYSNVDFWKHEYEKHGTCFNMSQFEYFNTTLSLYFNTSITEKCDYTKYECLIDV